MLMLISVHYFFLLFTQSYFNTSHVNVNPAYHTLATADCKISIHLMLMLIPNLKDGTRLDTLDFNTSHVNVNPATINKL